MPPDDDRDSLGDDTLDRMLGGGVPAGEAVLVTGERGTGKTTLALQFLATGVAAGDRCLFVSTEAPPAAVGHSGGSAGWDLEAKDFGVVAVTAQPGTVNDDQAITLETQAGDRPFDAFAAADASEYITRYVSQFAPVDRVVLDGASALATYQTQASPQTTLVDLLRVFTDEFDATTLLTAEGPAPIDPLQYLTAGTLHLYRESIDGDTHIEFSVRNLRGTGYDPRPVELTFDADGVTAPTSRGLSTSLTPGDNATTDIPGLDPLIGGGLVTGAGSLLRHDGRAPLVPLLSAVLAALHDQEYALTLIPPLDLGPTRLDRMLDSHDLDMDAMIADGDLYVVDFVGAWDTAESNVYGATDDRTQLEGVLREVDELTVGRRATVASADVLTHTLGAPDVRTLRYYQEGQLLGAEDVLLHVQNPGVVDATVAEFFLDAADQALSTWLTDDGRQYLSIEAAPSGAVGTTVAVEHTNERPYVTVDDSRLPMATSRDTVE